MLRCVHRCHASRIDPFKKQRPCVALQLHHACIAGTWSATAARQAVTATRCPRCVQVPASGGGTLHAAPDDGGPRSTAAAGAAATAAAAGTAAAGTCVRGSSSNSSQPGTPPSTAAACATSQTNPTATSAAAVHAGPAAGGVPAAAAATASGPGPAPPPLQAAARWQGWRQGRWQAGPAAAGQRQVADCSCCPHHARHQASLWRMELRGVHVPARGG
jgi:hypothetical protein